MGTGVKQRQSFNLQQGSYLEPASWLRVTCLSWDKGRVLAGTRFKRNGGERILEQACRGLQ